MKRIKCFESDSAYINKIYKQDGRVVNIVSSLEEQYRNVTRWDSVSSTNMTGSMVIIYRVEFGDVYCNIVVVTYDNGSVRDVSNTQVKKSDGRDVDSTVTDMQKNLDTIMGSREYSMKELSGSDAMDIAMNVINRGGVNESSGDIHGHIVMASDLQEVVQYYPYFDDEIRYALSMVYEDIESVSVFEIKQYNMEIVMLRTRFEAYAMALVEDREFYITQLHDIKMSDEEFIYDLKRRIDDFEDLHRDEDDYDIYFNIEHQGFDPTRY